VLRSLLRPLAALTLALALPAAASAETVKISFQRSSTLLITLKTSGALEKALKPLGYEVSWHEMTAGVIPTMTSRAVDFHADVADAVPVFTQAAGAPLTYFAKESASPKAQAIIVPKDSPIRTVAELKGRRVGVQRGSGSHYLLVANLARAGLTISDVEVAYLQPQDARPAFDRGALDAWVVWDPFLAQTEVDVGARVLADGSNGTSTYNRYYLVDRDYAAKHPDVVKAVYEALKEAGRWVKANKAESASLLSPLWGGIKTSTIERITDRRSYDVQPIQTEDFASQQKIADAFAEQKLIPKTIDLKAADVIDPTAAATR
jgi:sulfonate transport system substrate-binding protein